MDNLYYAIIVHIAVTAATVILIVFLLYKLIKRKNFTKKDIILLIILGLCLYTYIPFYFYKKALFDTYPEKYKSALKYYDTGLKFSFIPFERRLFHFDKASIYYFFDKNGEEAVKNMETALKGDYRYPSFLPHIYLIKGDYDKVREIQANDISSNDYFSALSYIMTDDYQTALDMLLKLEDKHYNHLMLISALYKQLGDEEKSQQYYNEAILDFKNLRFNDEARKQAKFNEILQYSTIEGFKSKLAQDKKEFKFTD